MKTYKAKFLTEFEETEINEYDLIYYMANNDLKVNPTKSERLQNNGYDDAEGYYRIF